MLVLRVLDLITVGTDGYYSLVHIVYFYYASACTEMIKSDLSAHF